MNMNDPKVVSLEAMAACRELAKQWGWENPASDILDMAGKSLSTKGRKTGEIVLQWNLMDADTRDRLLARKPHGVKTLHYFAEQEPSRILQYVEQILALSHQHPYYERLSILAPHQAMKTPEVVKACKEIDAVLMVVETTHPVLIFSRWDAMLAFSMMGTSDKLANPILKHNGSSVPLLAVGARDDISAVLKMHEGESDNVGSGENGARAWNVKMADADTEIHEKELARIFDHGLTIGASDAAFMPLRDGSVEIRLRKLGKLVEPFRAFSADGVPARKTILGPEIASRAINLLLSKSFAGDYTSLREPKDGQINYKSSTADAFMRLSFIPLSHLGEYKQLTSVSVRLFTRSEVTIDLKKLNIPDDVAEQIRDAMRMPQGLVMLSGPTNSGKSTTIAGALGEHVAMYGSSQKRISVEDPIERHLAGVTQINVPMHVPEEERFTTVLRGLHRHDPDLLWVGEVRDAQSAGFCVNYAVTGHLALTSIHAKDSILAYDNLSLKVKPEMRHQVIEAMSLSIAQRLIKSVCPHCSQKGCEPTADERRKFELNAKMTGEAQAMPETVTRVTNPAGCDKCDNGYSGELPILELLPFTREVKDAATARLFQDNPVKQREIMAKARTITLLQSGLRLMEQGLTDLDSILFF